MAKKEAAESVFEHEFTARVNKEGDHHEVILSSSEGRSGLTFVMRNQSGAKGFKDGGTYRAAFTAVHEPTAEERAAQMAGTAVECGDEPAAE